MDVADYILNEMGKNSEVTYVEKLADDGFHGVYYGQAALPMPAEQIKYMTWEGMDNIVVYDYETGKPVEIGLYDYDALEGMDSYEFYLYGSKSLITIENPEGTEGELIIFRGSFGSSIAPLLISGYEKIRTVVMVTHNSTFADIADTVIRVKNGKIQSITKNENVKDASEVSW